MACLPKETRHPAACCVPRTVALSSALSALRSQRCSQLQPLAPAPSDDDDLRTSCGPGLPPGAQPLPEGIYQRALRLRPRRRLRCSVCLVCGLRCSVCLQCGLAAAASPLSLTHCTPPPPLSAMTMTHSRPRRLYLLGLAVDVYVAVAGAAGVTTPRQTALSDRPPPSALLPPPETPPRPPPRIRRKKMMRTRTRSSSPRTRSPRSSTT